eukprot:TRINITY_DN19246_c0_g1_i2.p2 TRINITY_DN19246_c0_g1~~TRINITY_DN19246_c0_g1_i2.p2  ORF type:complete len:288 (+),score=32.67 TRINITY_DN19246_c0_g1_i2:113-976(+)
MPGEPQENLFTKKPEKVFFKQLEDAAAAEGKVGVLLKGFDNHERNMIIDARAYKIKNANREHTIIDWQNKCTKMFVNPDVVEEWGRIATQMNEIKKGKGGGGVEDTAQEMMALLESELKEVHDVMGKKWREANGKEASCRKSFAILFGLVMVFELEETWLLYASQIKAAVNKQFKAFGTSWKKVLNNDLEMLGVTQEQYDTVLEKLGTFNTHINHIEGVDIKFAYKQVEPPGMARRRLRSHESAVLSQVRCGHWHADVVMTESMQRVHVPCACRCNCALYIGTQTLS